MKRSKSNLKDERRASSSLEIEAAHLKEKLDKGEDLFILDVRSPEEHKAWKLSYDKYVETPVIPMDKLSGSPSQIAEQIPKDKEIVTLCAHGMRSQAAAQMLSKMGYNVKSIKGGMAAWNQVYDVAEVPLGDTTNDVSVWQLRRVSKGCMAYVIASGNSATVIDSTCDLDSSVLRLAEENDLKIVNVVDTHMHADHVSGLSALARKTGAKAYIGAKEGFEPSSDLKVNRLENGQELSLGDSASIAVIHTPGHTEDSLCFLLSTGKKSYLFTGDTLFVNGVGRPDLHSKAKEYATNLYNSYHDILLKYPDDTVILPAHFDTSSITVKHGELIMDTLGSVKRKYKLLSIPKDEFVKFMVSTVPPRPANYEKIVQINKQLMQCDQIKMGDLEDGPNSCAIRM
jgi:glyoxylase-like metal-dependent hydrolase (beta-lactamase superfamily II)/rhodanese-related sulfurtransferase